MTPHTIYLHVGHGKTGSSYIQSSLARSTESLRAHHITYPIAESVRKRAAQGLVTSGNLRPHPGSFAAALTHATDGPDTSLLFSNEGLFRTLFPDTLAEIRARFPQTPIKVLLLVRNPLENAASSYQEFVKQGKTRYTFAEFLERFRQPQTVVEFHKRCVDSSMDTTVLNFSHIRQDLLAHFETWLDLPEGALAKPAHMSVNRSLSRAEMALQSALNKYIGDDSAGFMGRGLCNHLPDIASDKPQTDAETLRQFQDRMQALVSEANDYFGHALYEVDDPTGFCRAAAEPDSSCFSQAQIDVISRLIAERLKTP